MRGEGKDLLKSVDKALQILESFSIDNPELTVSDLANKLSIPKVSIYRFLKVLMKKGFIGHNSSNSKYRLGLKMFELGSVVLRNMELRKAAFPLIEQLSERSGETVHLGILDGYKVVSIEGVESDHSLRISLPIGKSVFLHSTGIGKAILAFLPGEIIDKIIKNTGLPSFTVNTITDPAELRREMKLIRQRGYAVDNEENEEGIRCVAAPILDHSQRVVASISISGPAIRITGDRVSQFAKMVLDTTRKICRLLGYK